MWLGSEERPLSWWKIARLLGMKDPNYIYAWKRTSKRPSGYRIAQMFKLFKFKAFNPQVNFQKIQKIDWEKGVVYSADNIEPLPRVLEELQPRK